MVPFIQAGLSIFQSFQSLKDVKRQAQTSMENARRQREAAAANTTRINAGRVAELARLQDALMQVQFQAQGFKSQIAVQQGLTKNYSHTVQALQTDIDKQAEAAKVRALRNQQQLDIQRNQQIDAVNQQMLQSVPQIQSQADYASALSEGINIALEGYVQGTFNASKKPISASTASSVRNIPVEGQLYGASLGFNSGFNSGSNAIASGGALNLSKALGL